MKKRHIKKILAISAALTVLITFLLPMIQEGEMGQAVGKLSLSYQGVEKGLDLRGAAFDINRIKSKEVLSAAIKKAGLEKELTAEELRSQIMISPVTRSNALQELTQISSVAGKTKTVIQDSVNTGEYIIKLEDRDLLHPLSGKKLEKALLVTFKQYMKDSYLMADAMDSVYQKEEVLELDYPEMLKILKQEADSIVKYLADFESRYPEYIGDENGVSFGDLRKRAELIRDYDVGNSLDIVNYYMLTKDAEARKFYESTKLERNNLSAIKAVGKEQAINVALNTYNNSTNYLVAPEEAANVAVSNENLFYAQLAERYIAAKNQSIEARYESAATQKNIDKLNGEALTAAQKKALIKNVEESVKSAYSQMEQVKEQARLLAEENFGANIGNKIELSKVRYNLHMWGNIFVNFMILLILTVAVDRAYQGIKSKDKGFLKDAVTQEAAKVRNKIEERKFFNFHM